MSASNTERALVRAVWAPARKPGIKRTLQEMQRIQWRDTMSRDKVFRDIENPDDPYGPLSNVGQPSHLDRVDTVSVETTAAYYRRLSTLTFMLPYRLDKEIGISIADGKSMRVIKDEFKVGQSRIDRVKATMRAWVPEKYWREQE